MISTGTFMAKLNARWQVERYSGWRQAAAGLWRALRGLPQDPWSARLLRTVDGRTSVDPDYAMTQPLDSSSSDAAIGLESFCPPHYRSLARQLVPLLYADLKRIARQERNRHIHHDTVSTTALVHDAFLRLRDQPGFETHAHFLRASAITMRHLLIDRARAQLTQKGGGGTVKVGLEEAEDFYVEDDELVLAVHAALARLAQVKPRLAEIVECRFFAGFGDQEIAKALGIGARTVQREWALARAWLYRELGETANRIG